jgi:hypothetical protein
VWTSASHIFPRQGAFSAYGHASAEAISDGGSVDPGLVGEARPKMQIYQGRDWAIGRWNIGVNGEHLHQGDRPSTCGECPQVIQCGIECDGEWGLAL